MATTSTTTPEPITADAFEALTPGSYRVTFEGRTAWNAELQDDGVIAWTEPDNEKQHRFFPTELDEHVTVPSKPKWGKLVKITAR